MTPLEHQKGLATPEELTQVRCRICKGSPVWNEKNDVWTCSTGLGCACCDDPWEHSKRCEAAGHPADCDFEQVPEEERVKGGEVDPLAGPFGPLREELKILKDSLMLMSLSADSIQRVLEASQKRLETALEALGRLESGE